MVFLDNGQPTGKFNISSFQMSISPSLGLRFESNSHPWGKLVGTHNSLYRITERLQRVIIGDRKIMVTIGMASFSIGSVVHLLQMFW